MDLWEEVGDLFVLDAAASGVVVMTQTFFSLSFLRAVISARDHPGVAPKGESGGETTVIDWVRAQNCKEGHGGVRDDTGKMVRQAECMSEIGWHELIGAVLGEVAHCPNAVDTMLLVSGVDLLLESREHAKTSLT